jgi:cobaltochelatase CobT
LARAILKALKDAEDEERKEQQDQDQKQEGGDSSQGDQNQQANGSGGDANEDPQQSSADSSDDKQAQNSEHANESQSSQDSLNQSNDQGVTENGLGASLHERLSNETDLPEDAITQLRSQLADQAHADNHGETVSIDTASVGSDAANRGDSSSLQAGILASSSIRSRLLGLMQAETRQKQWLHTKGKRVDGKRLTRLASGDSRVFIQRDEMRRPDTSVHVLLDASGSMGCSQEVANQATVSLALAISTIPKCDIAASVFPGIGGEVSPIIRRGQQVRACLSRFAVRSDGGTPLAEAMLYAARELAASKRPRKVLIIITDGAPNKAGSVRYMNSLIEKHVDVYAIGIGSTAVSHFFKKWSVINDVNELQKALFTVAGQFLKLN